MKSRTFLAQLVLLNYRATSSLFFFFLPKFILEELENEFRSKRVTEVIKERIQYYNILTEKKKRHFNGDFYKLNYTSHVFSESIKIKLTMYGLMFCGDRDQNRNKNNDYDMIVMLGKN